MSLRDFLRLAVEDDLELYSARYDYAVAQVDILRAESGQAVRGTPSSPPLYSSCPKVSVYGAVRF